MSKRPLVNIVIVFIIVAAISFGIFFYFKLHKLQSSYSEKQEREKTALILKEKNNLISKVSLLYMFPEGETPTIATVSDPVLLKDQSFFTASEKGDKVLIFTNSAKAVLYRPSINKIIDIVSVQSNPNNK